MTGKAVPDATVTIDSLSVTTDANGAYRFDSAPVGSKTVRATKTFYLSTTTDVVLLAGVNVTLDLRIRAVGQVAGRITDSQTSAPIADAAVTIGGATSYSDSNGGYFVVNVPPATHVVRVSRVGYSTRTTLLVVQGGQVTTQDFQLHQSGSISGLVTAAVGGAPIAGAVLTTVNVAGVTDAAGRYTLDGVDAGNATLSVAASGYNHLQVSVAVTAGRVSSADIQLTVGASATVSGKVVDAETGTPLANVPVAFFDDSGRVNSLYTDATGTYTISTTSGKRLFYVNSSLSLTPLKGYSSYSPQVLVYAGAPTITNFTIHPYRVLLVHVLDAKSGGDLVGANVTYQSFDQTVYASTLSDERGNAVLAKAAAGPGFVTVGLKGYNSLPLNVNFPPGIANALEAPLITQPVLKGIVTDLQTGATLVGATVTISDVGGNVVSQTKTVASGAYVCTAAVGSMQVSASMAGYTNASSLADLPATGDVIVNLALPRAGTTK